MVIFIARTAAQILKEKEREKWIHSKIQQQKNESYKKPIKEIKAAQTKKKKEEKKKKKKKYQLQKKKKQKIPFKKKKKNRREEGCMCGKTHYTHKNHNSWYTYWSGTN